jgi:hypothetical protein
VHAGGVLVSDTEESCKKTLPPVPPVAAVPPYPAAPAAAPPPVPWKVVLSPGEELQPESQAVRPKNAKANGR